MIRISKENSARAGLLLLVVCVFLAWRHAPPFVSKISYYWLWLQFLIFVMILIPRPLIGASIWAFLIGILNYASTKKIELIQFPITHQDLEIAANDPVGLLDAIGIAHAYQLPIVVALAVALVIGLVRPARRYWSHIEDIGQETARLGTTAACIMASAFLFGQFYMAYGKYLNEHRNAFLRADASASPARAASLISTFGFLAFSNAAGTDDVVRFKHMSSLDSRSDAGPIGAAAEHLLAGAEKSARLPNIVFVLAESTFDPNAAFQLSRHAPNSLFEHKRGEIGGLLDVTPVGGGTWKTEFETITGMDSRIFGFLGEYTHVTLAPHVRQSFATYLKARDYETASFYPTYGKFYNAKHAYEYYGFDKFYDVLDLNLEVDWTRFSDEKMASTVIGKFSDSVDKPFFYYVVFLENHSPHSCQPQLQDDVTFVPEAEPGKQCKLNEYLRKAKSSARGFEQITDKLKQVERKTGRPFVAVIFGDHQPHTFTDVKFDRYRTKLSKHETFFKIVKSDSLKLPAIDQTFHATLLPTIVSSIVATNPKEIFMPASLYAQQKCPAMDTNQGCLDPGFLARSYRAALVF